MRKLLGEFVGPWNNILKRHILKVYMKRLNLLRRLIFVYNSFFQSIMILARSFTPVALVTNAFYAITKVTHFLCQRDGALNDRRCIFCGFIVHHWTALWQIFFLQYIGGCRWGYFFSWRPHLQAPSRVFSPVEMPIDRTGNSSQLPLTFLFLLFSSTLLLLLFLRPFNFNCVLWNGQIIISKFFNFSQNA